MFCLMNFHITRVSFYNSGIFTGKKVIPQEELFTLITEKILTRDKTANTLFLLLN